MKWFAAVSLFVLLLSSCAPAPGPPNILWITSEDNGPHLGVYGYDYATTPNLDGLAAKGMIYTNAWSNAPVCAPARTTIISGMYPNSLGAEHMRSLVPLPEGFKMYPQYLREAGYYCTNNSKEDYNLIKPGQVWDESSNKAHWRNRAEGQPFFAIFNFTTTHESQIRKRPHTPVHDPAKVPIPAYHPDTPEVRQDWAQYHDKMTEMDTQAGEILAQLAEDGLAEDTIVFYYGDHGPGMPRGKRWPYNSGLQVPLIVMIPPKYKHLAPKDWQIGGRRDELVGFVDLAPTVLSLAGIQPPAHMQGRAFLGPNAAPEPEFHFGFRGRMDERYDMVRTARNKRFVYLRHFMPHKVYGQYISYMFQTPTTVVWKKLFDEGKLTPEQSLFWQTKPAEELYDLENDPDEVRNLAGSPEHQEVLETLRTALRKHLLEIGDAGLLPECELHSRSEGRAPYETTHGPGAAPLADILAAAELASSLKPGVESELIQAMGHPDSAVRYWGAMGFLMRGREAVTGAREALLKALGDEAPSVRIAAGEALGRYGTDADARQALKVLMGYANPAESNIYLSMMALNAIDYMGDRAKSAKAAIAKFPSDEPGLADRPSELRRPSGYPGRLIEHITGQGAAQ